MGKIETSRPGSRPTCLSACMASRVAEAPGVLPATFLPLRSRGSLISFLLNKNTNGRATVKIRHFTGRPCTAALITPLTAPL